MPASYAYAPGKVILTGEHAVVYGQAAIAAPVNEVRARASIEAAPGAAAGTVTILAPDIDLKTSLSDLPVGHPLDTIFRGVQNLLGIRHLPAMTLNVSSTIPLAAGLGSGAAISVAVTRALSAFLGSQLTDEQVSQLAYETDRYYHGTPSGIDNTVITYGRLVYFRRNQPIEMLVNEQALTLLIADTGEKSHTGEVVGDLRKRVELEPDHYHAIFNKIGEISQSTKGAIEKGDPDRLGNLFIENHALLQELDVSSSKLDDLVTAAMEAGALGAKMSGAGRGGNMIALVDGKTGEAVSGRLKSAGAVKTILTTIPKTV